MAKIQYITRNGFDKIKKELDHLKSVERPSISRQIGEARDKGDLSENAEYDAAKEAQGLLELKISQLESKLRDSKMIDESKVDTTKVQILSKVTLKNTKNKSVVTYTIVPEGETDLKSGKISIETPIAKGILGKKVGETAKVTVPAGEMEFEIVDLSV